VASASRHILVVDDEPHIGLLLRPHLEQLNYRVSLARTLAAARAALAASPTPVDVLLLDLHLPDGSGMDWLRELRATPDHRTLPVLVLTGEDADRIQQAIGVLDATFLTKPFSPSKLVARIEALLRDAPTAPPPAPPRPPGYTP